MRQRVVVVVPEGGSLFEIATPLRVWGPDPTAEHWPPVDLVGLRDGRGPGGPRGTAALPRGLTSLDDHADTADMIIVPTWPVDGRPVLASLVEPLRRAHARGCRIVGLCLGAFAVAEAGLLDGRTAVTHWGFADEFERRFPAVTLDRGFALPRSRRGGDLRRQRGRPGLLPAPGPLRPRGRRRRGRGALTGDRAAPLG